MSKLISQALVVLALGWAGNSHAVPIEFHFDPGVYSLSGVFSYDFESGTYADVQIDGREATYCCNMHVFGSEWTVHDDFLHIDERHRLLIVWDSISELTPEGGSYNGYESGECIGGLCSTIVWSGTVSPVSAVPVPAAIWLFGSALLGLAGIRRKKA